MVRYGVIGAGRQGTAAAYFLAQHADIDTILLADQDPDTAARAAERINQLVGADRAVAQQVDIGDEESLAETLASVDVVVCAAPYRLILPFTRAAIAAGTSMVDLGGHTETVRRQLELEPAARQAGVTVVPDCGMAPGMSNLMGLAVLDRLGVMGAIPFELRLFEGGLPVDPTPPWGYVASFNLEGLTNEYEGDALFLRDGRVTRVQALTEPERVWIDELGSLEAFVTSGGTSTLAHSLEGVLATLENKTLRYPGHHQSFKAFRDLGLFSEEPVKVNGSVIRPRELYHALLRSRLLVDQVKDVGILRARGVGERAGDSVVVILELILYHQPETRFSAMETITGGHAALVAALIGRGVISPGVRTLEHTVPPLTFLDEAKAWGFDITERVHEAAATET